MELDYGLAWVQVNACYSSLGLTRRRFLKGNHAGYFKGFKGVLQPVGGKQGGFSFPKSWDPDEAFMRSGN